MARPTAPAHEVLDGGAGGERLLAAFQLWSTIAGLLTVAIGVIVLIGGYWMNVGPLRSVASNWPPMRANAAIMCALGGLSLAALARTPVSKGRGLIGIGGAAMLGLIAGLTLFEHITGRDLGIDLLIAPSAAAVSAPYGARTPVQPTFSFLLLSGALILLSRKRYPARWLIDLFAIVSASIGAIGIFGYLHRAPELYQLPARGLSWGMALLVGGALVVLGSGVVCARPDSGIASGIASTEAGGYMARRLLVVVMLVFPAIAVLAEAGWWAGFYSHQDASALVLLFGIATGALGILFTGRRLNRASSELRRALVGATEWKHFFRGATWGVVMIASDGSVLCVNSAYARMRGVRPADLVGKPAADLCVPEERLLFDDRVEVAAKNGYHTFESIHVREDGTPFPVLIDVTAATDEAGRLIHYVLYVQDMTVLKEADRRLREADAETLRRQRRIDAVKRAHLAISDAVLCLPERGRDNLLAVIVQHARELSSARYAALGFGIDPDKPFNPWVQSGVSAEQAKAIGRNPHPLGVLHVAARGDAVRLRDLKEHPDHLGFPANHPALSSFLGVPILGRGGRVATLYLADKRDATEFTDEDQTVIELLAARASVALEATRLYESATRERAWLKAAVEHMPDPVILVDAEGALVLENEASKTWGRTEGPLDPWGHPTLHDLRWPDGTRVSTVDRPLYRALLHGEETRGAEHCVRLPSGEMLPILASAAPVIAEGRVLGAVATFRDIRALKEVELLRKEWSAIVAHDLRQPVAVIGVAAQQLERASSKQPFAENATKAIARIKGAVARVTVMIDELLDVAQLEAGRLAIAPRAVDVGALAREVVDRSRDPARGRTVVVNESEGSHMAWADPARVEQVLANLVSNACKYGTAGTEIRIDVEARANEVELTVTNRGPGVTPEEMPKLFQRFMRSRESNLSGAPGVGLGLYICKGLVEAHGGRIWVESTPGQTTSFHFTLPTREGRQRSPVAA